MWHNVLYHPLWDWIVFGACGVGMVLAGWFAVSYQIQSRGAWRETRAGRFLVTRKVLLFSLFASVMSYRVFGDFPGRRVLVALMLVAFAFQTWVPYRMLMDAQAERERQRREMRQHHPDVDASGSASS